MEDSCEYKREQLEIMDRLGSGAGGVVFEVRA